MGKKKQAKFGRPKELKLFPRGQPTGLERSLFLHVPRNHSCLRSMVRDLLYVNKLDRDEIRKMLAFECTTIEHQILTLRDVTQLSKEDYAQRYLFTQCFLECLYRHHKVVYEGILFGSTINGLGFRDSDVDLRLRPLKKIEGETYEPVLIDEEMVDKTLRNIAHQTTRCCQASGEFVPSSRCPVAKLTFVDPRPSNKCIESLKYDVSLSSSNPLGTFNSMFLRFLCHLQPKFHLLATILRYWSNVHQLIVPGYLSSYALINMVIFFCQTVEPPLLPNINFMRDLYFKKNPDICNNKKGLTQLEWHCIVCLKKEFYLESVNNEPLAILLFKFFEMYLNFPFSTHIVTTRPGRALTHEEFKNSNQFHQGFPLNTFLNVQDPFDLRHNLTSGMQGSHFKLLMLTIRCSYERLYTELMQNFCKPQFTPKDLRNYLNAKQTTTNRRRDSRDWGLNALFLPINEQESNGV